MSATQLIAELKTLSTKAGENCYRRIVIAEQILADREWIQEHHGGDPWKAASALEDDFFDDLSGAISLWGMLEILRHFPNESDWKKRKYSLRKLQADINPPENKPQRVKEKLPRINRDEYESIKQERDTLLKSVDSQQKKLKKLEVENIELKGRLKELERVLDKLGAAMV